MNTTIQGLILDMDGVLWRETQPIGNLAVIFNEISSRGLKVILATNNSTRTTSQYLKKLAGYGVFLQPWQVISSAIATARYLVNKHPGGGNVYVVGEDGLIQVLRDSGYIHRDDATGNGHEEIIAVVVGLDRNLTYDKLRQATRLVRSGVPFIATNLDPTLPTPEGLYPGAGAIIAALVAATSTEPILIGKPAPEMYLAALDILQEKPESVLVVGDRPETDIAGAQAIGCRTALVLSGATSLEKAHAWKPAPDIIVTDLSAVLTNL